MDNLELWRLSAATNGKLVLSPWRYFNGKHSRFNGLGSAVVNIYPVAKSDGQPGDAIVDSFYVGLNVDPGDTVDAIKEKADAALVGVGCILAEDEPPRRMVNIPEQKLKRPRASTPLYGDC